MWSAAGAGVSAGVPSSGSGGGPVLSFFQQKGMMKRKGDERGQRDAVIYTCSCQRAKQDGNAVTTAFPRGHILRIVHADGS